MALPSFLADGNTKTFNFADFIIDRETGPLDFDAFVAYVEATSPITQQPEGRITLCYQDLDDYDDCMEGAERTTTTTTTTPEGGDKDSATTKRLSSIMALMMVLMSVISL